MLDTHTTSEQTMPKAYLFLDSLIKSVEKASGKLKLTNEHSFFIINNEEIFFQLKEKQNRLEIPESERKDKWGDRYRFTPTGFLTVIVGHKNIRGDRYSDSIKEFKETQTRTLDLIVKDVFAFIFDQPNIIRLERDAYKKQLDQEKICEDERQRKRKIHEDEFKRTKKLIKMAKHYELSMIIYRYLEHLEKNNNETTASFLTWAKMKADWFDPTDLHDDVVLDELDKDALSNEEDMPRKYSLW